MSEYQDSTFTITQQAKQKGIFLAIPIVLGLAGLFIYVGFFKDAPVIFGFCGAFFLVVFMFAMAYDLFTTPRYIVRPDRIKIHRLTPWGETKGITFQSGKIESIDIKRHVQISLPAVVVSTDNKCEAIGVGLSREAKEWLKDCLVYSIAKG